MMKLDPRMTVISFGVVTIIGLWFGLGYLSGLKRSSVKPQPPVAVHIHLRDGEQLQILNAASPIDDDGEPEVLSVYQGQRLAFRAHWSTVAYVVAR